MQYAKIQLYQTLHFTFKSCNFQQETQQSWHVMSNNTKLFVSPAPILSFEILNMNYTDQKIKQTELTFARIGVSVHTANYFFKIFFV